eukprot:tig00020537_g10309.t1
MGREGDPRYSFPVASSSVSASASDPRYNFDAPASGSASGPLDGASPGAKQREGSVVSLRVSPFEAAAAGSGTARAGRSVKGARRSSLRGSGPRASLPAPLFDEAPVPRRRFKIGLRAVGLPAIALILIAAVTSIGILSYRAAEENATRLSDQVLFHVGRRVQENLVRLFEAAVQSTAQMARQLTATTVAPVRLVEDDWPRALGAARAAALTANFYSIAYILTDGTGFLLRRELVEPFMSSVPKPLEPWTVTQTVFNRTTRRLDRFSYYFDKAFNATQLWVTYGDPYDPRTRPFWQAAVSTKAGSWTDVYALTTGSAAVSFAQPFFYSLNPLLEGDAPDSMMARPAPPAPPRPRRPGGERGRQGMLVVTFDLRTLSEWLATVAVTVDGQGFAAVLGRDASGELFVIAYKNPR